MSIGNGVRVLAAHEEARVAALCADEGYSLVDGWSSAETDLLALAALPVPPAGLGDQGSGLDWASDGRFVILEWRRTIVRVPRGELFHVLRTARNRHLIDDVEQAAWGGAKIGVAGLSVGSSALIACALTGARDFRIADADEIAVTNLNRVAASVVDIGLPKIESARRRVLELDPYAAVETFAGGYTPDMASRFLVGLSVVIEETDDIAAKLDIRVRARAARIPVVMATDLGDGLIVDVERFDLDPDYPLLHGRGEPLLGGDMTDPAWRARAAVALVGDAAPPRMIGAVGELGRSITSWPQLGSTAAQAGALAAAAARYVVTGRPLASGRYRVGVEEMFGEQALDPAI
ncbi:ThiF family adenylyltransferase [Tsukamurella soli]|uniref:THIF-type NAD/FAD binding fold domain-containing protein n=1 Tax=Tsukamurella soli TaxID=644556 RepID=A0ABP8J486_9ACTN